VFFPLASRAAVDAAAPHLPAFRALCREAGLDDHAMFVFSLEAGPDGATAYSRMFAPGLGVAEDPATGAASGPLGCYLVKHGAGALGGAGRIVSLQGVKMQRPSRVHISIRADAGGIHTVRVGGEAVLVGEGHLDL